MDFFSNQLQFEFFVFGAVQKRETLNAINKSQDEKTKNKSKATERKKCLSLTSIYVELKKMK